MKFYPKKNVIRWEEIQVFLSKESYFYLTNDDEKKTKKSYSYLIHFSSSLFVFFIRCKIMLILILFSTLFFQINADSYSCPTNVNPKQFFSNKALNLISKTGDMFRKGNMLSNNNWSLGMLPNGRWSLL